MKIKSLLYQVLIFKYINSFWYSMFREQQMKQASYLFHQSLIFAE